VSYHILPGNHNGGEESYYESNLTWISVAARYNAKQQCHSLLLTYLPDKYSAPHHQFKYLLSTSLMTCRWNYGL